MWKKTIPRHHRPATRLIPLHWRFGEKKADTVSPHPHLTFNHQAKTTIPLSLPSCNTHPPPFPKKLESKGSKQSNALLNKTEQTLPTHSPQRLTVHGVPLAHPGILISQEEQCTTHQEHLRSRCPQLADRIF